MFKTVSVTKIGETLVLVLPGEVVSRFQLKEGGSVFLDNISEGGFSFKVDHVMNAQLSAADNIIRRYPATLRNLA